MGMSSTFANDIMKLFFNATPIANVADNAISSPFTNVYVSLYTADPGSGGNQGTNEIAYTGYARVAVSRATANWPVTSNAVSPAATVTFATSASTTTATFWGVGQTSTAGNSGLLFYSGAISPTITIVTGTIPALTSSSTITQS